MSTEVDHGDVFLPHTARLTTADDDTGEYTHDALHLADLDTETLREYDVLWWHRRTALDEQARTELSAASDALLAFVEQGGGLLLTHGAVAAASGLGIESHDPDAVGRLDGDDVGFLVRRPFLDHPVFDGIEGLRPEQTPRSDAVSVHYESVHPKDADVFAATRVDGSDRPALRALLGWRVGDGRVVGVGHGLGAIESDLQSRLLQNLHSYLRGDHSDPPTVGRPKGKEEFEALRGTIPDPNHRPVYHFSPPANWLNDPNGLVQWNGQYHLFYQYNPGGPFHGTIHWGHAVSEDLCTWEDRPLALEPDPSGPDAAGCFSGCFVDDDGRPSLMYTGCAGDDQLPCLARASDERLIDWEKSAANPLLDGTLADIDLLQTVNWTAEFRDHCVWRTDGTWYQLIGSGIDEEGGAALLYRSENLLEWEYCRPILTGDWRKTGPIWECPELLQFDNGSLLHVSDYDNVWYFTGEYDDSRQQFDASDQGCLDHGVFYAPQSFEDDSGRTLMFGWLKETRDQQAQWDAGWSGAMSLPRVVSLSDDGDLQFSVPEELEQLRDQQYSFSDLSVAPGETGLLDGIEGDTLELKLTVDAANAGEFGIVLRSSPDGEERTVVRCKSWKRELTVDRAASSLSDRVERTPESMPINLEDGTLTIHVFLDRSVLEVFANDAQALSTRIYPTREDSVEVDLYATDRDVTVKSLDIWTLSLF